MKNTRGYLPMTVELDMFSGGYQLSFPNGIQLGMVIRHNSLVYNSCV